jgi:uncharacterized protein YbaR (Trm112 family)
VSSSPTHEREKSVIPRDLLERLVCPETRTRLTMADAALVARLNAAIAARALVNCAGQPIERPIQGGLVRQDGRMLYPVIDDIPSLLADRAIPLDQVDRP